MDAIEQLAATSLDANDAQTRKLLWRLIELDSQILENDNHPCAANGAAAILSAWNEQLDQTADAETRAPESSIRNLLVIDDDPRCCKIITLMLERIGTRATTARNANEARAALKANTQFQGIICDYALLDIAGDDLMMQLREEGCKLPYILISGHTHSEADDFNVDLGMPGLVGTLTKPFTATELASLLKN